MNRLILRAKIMCLPNVKQQAELIVTAITYGCNNSVAEMGCFGSKDKLSKEDMDFLKSHTRYDEATIKEWYKGFKVSYDILSVS